MQTRTRFYSALSAKARYTKRDYATNVPKSSQRAARWPSNVDADNNSPLFMLFSTRSNC
jgi:hypothetical protein